MKSNRYHSPRLEQLEIRLVPATFGIPWADPQNMTVSFAPDNTSVAGQKSELAATLGTNLSASAWQGALLKAIQTWTAQGNVNVSFTADSGAAFGDSGLAEGDPRYGDIRFGAVSLSSNEVALAHPYDNLIGSWSGDVLFNTNATFGDGTKGTYDLYTVALHEVGHVFGLDDNNTLGSVMYHNYAGIRTGLSAGDITAFQALYGPRLPTTSTATASTATAIAFAGKNDKVSATVVGDVSSSTEVDSYTFIAPKGKVSISLQTAGISMLAGQLTVVNSSNHVIGSVTNLDPTRQNPLSLSLSLNEGQTYSIRVQGAPGSAFGVGSYDLMIVGPKAKPLPGADVNFTNAGNDSAHAVPLQAVPGTTNFEALSAIQHTGDSNYFSLTVPQSGAGAQTLTLSAVSIPTSLLAQGQDSFGGDDGPTQAPQVELSDASGTLVPAVVTVNDNGTYSIQVSQKWVAGATYSIRVFSTSGTTVYGLLADFQATVPVMDTVGTTTLNDAQQQAAQGFTVTRTELYHFSLAATGSQATGGVRMTILDASGAVVGSLMGSVGQTVSANVWLDEGNYTFVYAGGTSDQSSLQNLLVTLQLENASDAIDPYIIDPTSTPTTDPSMIAANLIVPAVPPPPMPVMLVIPPTPTAPPPSMIADTLVIAPTYTTVWLSGPFFLDPTNPYSNPFWY